MKILVLLSVIAQMSGLVLIYLYSTSPFHSNEGATYLFNEAELTELEKAGKRRKFKVMLGYLLCLAGIAMQIFTAFS